MIVFRLRWNLENVSVNVIETKTKSLGFKSSDGRLIALLSQQNTPAPLQLLTRPYWLRHLSFKQGSLPLL